VSSSELRRPEANVLRRRVKEACLWIPRVETTHRPFTRVGGLIRTVEERTFAELLDQAGKERRHAHPHCGSEAVDRRPVSARIEETTGERGRFDDSRRRVVAKDQPSVPPVEDEMRGATYSDFPSALPDHVFQLIAIDMSDPQMSWMSARNRLIRLSASSNSGRGAAD
jgi:hypothetical protein